MSTQRGNINRTRAPKYQNKTKFNNLKYDSNHRSKAIANTLVVQVCEPCQNVIQWKIKFKKYKPLTQPKTCTKCCEKAIKHAYHTVCIKCSNELDLCGKCGKKKAVIISAPVDQATMLRQRAAIDNEAKSLRLRARKAFYRHMDRLNGVCVKVPLELLETEEDLMRNEQMIKNEKASALSHKDYMREARAKLDELLSKPVNVKSCLRDLDDDLDDLGLGSDDEEDEESVFEEGKSAEENMESANSKKVERTDKQENSNEGDDTEDDLEGTDSEDGDYDEKGSQADNKTDDACD